MAKGIALISGPDQKPSSRGESRFTGLAPAIWRSFKLGFSFCQSHHHQPSPWLGAGWSIPAAVRPHDAVMIPDAFSASERHQHTIPQCTDIEQASNIHFAVPAGRCAIQKHPSDRFEPRWAWQRKHGQARIRLPETPQKSPKLDGERSSLFPDQRTWQVPRARPSHAQLRCQDSARPARCGARRSRPSRDRSRRAAAGQVAQSL